MRPYDQTIIHIQATMQRHDLRCRAGPPAAPSVGPARGGGGVDVAGGATPHDRGSQTTRDPAIDKLEDRGACAPARQLPEPDVRDAPTARRQVVELVSKYVSAS